MVLHELHVLERNTGAVRQRHAVAVLDGGVGGERKYLPAATGAKDDALRENRHDLSGGELDGDDPLTASIVDQELSDEKFVVTLDGVVLQSRLEEAM